MKFCYLILFSFIFIFQITPTPLWAVDNSPNALASKPPQQHFPYSAGLCTMCHKTGADGKIIEDEFKAQQPDLCYQCHEKKDQESVVHPALFMDCTMCHNPHESQYRPFLKKPVKETCTMCHDAPGRELPIKHMAIDMVKSCVRCHNPHSSPNDKLLRAPTTELCVQCHTPIGKGLQNTANTIHPAVYMGCENCHMPHGSNNERLLKEMPNQLCFKCHDEKHFAGGHPKRGHPTSGKLDPIYPDRELSCISCHKPHFSPNKRMLRYNFTKPPYDGMICSVCHWQQLLPPPGPPKPKWDD